MSDKFYVIILSSCLLLLMGVVGGLENGACTYVTFFEFIAGLAIVVLIVFIIHNMEK